VRILGTYTILLKNSSSLCTSFYIVQDPGTNSLSSNAKSNSLGSNKLAPGSQWQFIMDTEVLAAVEGPANQSWNNITISRDIVSHSLCSQKVLIGSPPVNCTELSLNPLSLSAPTYNNSRSDGWFAIKVPPYTPSSNPNQQYLIGGGVVGEQQVLFLSYYINAPPNQTIWFAQKPIFYVSVGGTSQGQEAAIPESGSRATCVFQNNGDVIVVTYKADGTWSPS
jgi:hypothetical protein